jgi:hypothetical protein
MQRVLAAVPDKNIDWRSHPKSPSAVELTAFVAGRQPRDPVRAGRVSAPASAPWAARCRPYGPSADAPGA